MNRLMLLGFLLATATAHGNGTLQFGEPTVEQDRITVPVLLGGDLGGGVSAMDFRFLYNPEAVQPISVVAGAVAASADKRVMSNQRTPGEYSVVMMGFNQSSCGPGEAIRIVLQRLHGSDQNWDLSLSDPTMSSVDGRLIQSEVLPSDIEFADDAETDQDQTDSRSQLPQVGAEARKQDSNKASQPGPVYDTAIVEPSGTSNGIAPKESADALKSALQSARDARQAIDAPGQETGSAETGIPGAISLDSAFESEGRTNMAGLVGAGSPKQVSQNKTVELQSQTNAARPPAGSAARGVTYTPYVAGAVAVFVLAAALVWRRSRLSA